MSKISKTNVNHAAGIFADMSVDGPAIGTLVAIVDRAKNLPNRKTMGKQNPYCAARLGKEAKKTPTDLRGGQTPRWDHELRFTVHESPDYFRMKLSIFNDDKKSDLIGETWVDLQNLIIPGGSQNDHWHVLQSRGKYAGEVRLEMTYYDTREQDETVIERRKGAAERAQGKVASPSTSSALSGASTASAASGLSGPRQLEKVKRRPLPTGLSGATPARPPAPEHVQSAPSLHHPMPAMPARPAVRDIAQTMPLAAAPEPLSYIPRQPEPSYDTQSYAPSSDMQPRGGYDGSDDYQREWSAPPSLPAAGMVRSNTQETPYHTPEAPNHVYDSRPQQPRSHPDYDRPPSRDYRSASEPPFDSEMDARMQYDAVPQVQDAYSQMASPQYNVNPVTFGQVSTFSPHLADNMPAPSNYGRPGSSSGPADDLRYQPRFKALPPAHVDEYHPEYAGMQPSVEDEEDFDRPPPPPPVHRSRMAQHASAAPSAQSPNITQLPSSYRPYNPSVPASLVAGFEAHSHADHAVYEDRSGRRRSALFDDEMMLAQQPEVAPAPAPSHYEAPIYPLRTSPRPMDDYSGIIVSRAGQARSVSPDTRMITRKSVSPRPSSSDSRAGSSVPFSPTPTTPSITIPGLQALGGTVSSRSEFESIRDPNEPIIGDDGREIDPSDHLPTETWAPEPEKKNRKPEVIIRFKNSPRPTSRGNDTPVRSTPPRVGFRTTPDTSSDYRRYNPSVHSDFVERTPPRADRGQESYSSVTHSRGYSTPTSADRPRSSHRGSVSPTPSARSPLYDYSPGPPIPSKVPVSQGAPAYPVASSNVRGGRPGMDALSRELSTIDIGSASCSPSRAVRRYAPPRPSASMGYAS
ncbi:uncharacterized protein N7477_007104 [Penicillium maclennaniae]|uniref:uncharacterized protein n=1 Tax=Penicillium maclennaniae TaxID=1343394 RepID=UPI00254239A9|nr:uncharacterized protein N7477_007104 [Penicillium maclennaniae]KAJ5668534.1 hypothetical protein N7477_007104 [Penicillium maclennaniae]